MPEPPDGRGLLLVISGPSGSGKTTIARAIEQRLGGEFSISATTRPPSGSETGGRDYRFVSEPEFEAMARRGEFLEHAQVYGRHFYGTPREPVERALAEGRLVILDIDVQGAAQVKAAIPEALAVFVLPPDDGELARRLRGRGRDDAESIERRLLEARLEIETGRRSEIFDARIVNGDLEEAIEEACRLVRRRRDGR